MKEKKYSNTPPYYFPKRKKGKKESNPSSGGMQRCKGPELSVFLVFCAAEALEALESGFIYPCFFVSPELTFAALFISFGLIRTTATLGVVVGATEGKTTQQRFDKTFATAFKAANSFLKNFGRRVSLRDFLICCLSALAWDGEHKECGYFA